MEILTELAYTLVKQLVKVAGDWTLEKVVQWGLKGFMTSFMHELVPKVVELFLAETNLTDVYVKSFISHDFE